MIESEASFTITLCNSDDVTATRSYLLYSYGSDQRCAGCILKPFDNVGLRYEFWRTGSYSSTLFCSSKLWRSMLSGKWRKSLFEENLLSGSVNFVFNFVISGLTD
jgi:hypothetical protein